MGGAAASPLVEIERAVQGRAKDISLEMAAPGGEVKLRALIADEVARWNDDHRRGRRAFALPDPELVVDRAFRNLARYGPLTALLADEDVWEVMVNAPDAVFVRRHRGPSGYHDEVFHDDDHVVRVLTKLLDDASSAHRSLDPAEGLQDAQLDDGARVHIVHGDIARGGHVLVNIRKFTGIPFKSLGELVERDMLTVQVADLLAACVRARLSIVFAGPPGSGKSTLLSCTTAELDPSLRVVVAEEVFESDIPVPNVAQMQTRAARADRAGVDLRRLVAGFLRMAPDVAVVGEVRDREGLPELLSHVDMRPDLGWSIRHGLAGPTGGQSSVLLGPGEAICLPGGAPSVRPGRATGSVASFGGSAPYRHLGDGRRRQTGRALRDTCSVADAQTEPSDLYSSAARGTVTRPAGIGRCMESTRVVIDAGVQVPPLPQADSERPHHPSGVAGA
jgi:Flp pilus assembly CpaF family ATPase